MSGASTWPAGAQLLDELECDADEELDDEACDDAELAEDEWAEDEADDVEADELGVVGTGV